MWSWRHARRVSSRLVSWVFRLNSHCGLTHWRSARGESWAILQREMKQQGMMQAGRTGLIISACFCLARNYEQGLVMRQSGKMVKNNVGCTKEWAVSHSAPSPQVCREQQALHNRTFRWGGRKGRTRWLDSAGHVRLPLRDLIRLRLSRVQRRRGGGQRWRERGCEERGRWRRRHHHNGSQDPE